MQSFFLLRYSIPFSRKSLLFLPFSNSHFASYFASFQIFGFFFPGISCAIPWRVSSAQKTICSRSFSLFFHPPRGGGCIFLFLRQQPFLILLYLYSFSLFWVWSPLLTPFSSFFCPFFSVAPRGPFYLTNILFWSFSFLHLAETFAVSRRLFLFRLLFCFGPRVSNSRVSLLFRPTPSLVYLCILLCINL